MSTIQWIVGVLVLIVVAFFAMQLLLVRKMQRQKGKPAPKLEGKAGKWIAGGNVALFYFYSPNCGACRAMTPTVKKLAKDYKGVFPIDISQDMNTAHLFGVMATPTTVVIEEGVIQNILIGPQPSAHLEQLVSDAA